MKARIQIENLSFKYPSRPGRSRSYIFRGLSAAFEAGSSVALLGPNGAGKSTLLNLIAGHLKPAEGRALICGADISETPSDEAAKLISVVPQEHHPAFNFTAREMILMGRSPHNGFFGIANESDHEIVGEVSRKTDLEGLLDNEYTKLSGGERKRVLLARAMAQRTPVMLFDEPEAHLDIRHQHMFFKSISGLARDEKKLCVYSVHNPSLALRYSTVIVLMDACGENIIIGPTAEVMTCRNLETAYGIRFAMTREGASGPLLYVDA
ncbi:MAG TPA: ABC transporter ATP-binding protein [Candidatus Wallbacteria bacterium]|nr:ABC transporter ATP-binding protein [Candidatus Wallbacteria bacterium]